MLANTKHIFLSLLLLISTAGFVISKHYCGGELVSTSFFGEAKSCCDSGDCCHNESITFQLHEDFSVSSIIEVPKTIQLDLFDFALILFENHLEEGENSLEFILADLPPPPKIQTTLSLKQTYLL